MSAVRVLVFAIIATIGLMPSNSFGASIDGKWFLHSFGEMRAYFGDFLAVCDEEGFRRCRIVQYGFGPQVDVEGNPVASQDGFFGNSRLSIQQEFDANVAPTFQIEIFSTKLSDVPKGPMTLSIDGQVFQLTEDDWQAGSPEGYNVAKTFSIIEPSLNAEIIAAVKAGNRLRVLHDGWSETHFQLRGITRALMAIEKREFN